MSTRRVLRQDDALPTTGDGSESHPAPGITVVIPCLNERTTIAEAVVEARAAFADWPGGVEVAVADNGSTDGSAELARAMGARVVLAVDRGYGVALQAGFAAARTPYIVYADLAACRDCRRRCRRCWLRGVELGAARVCQYRVSAIHPLPPVCWDGHGIARHESFARPSAETGLGRAQGKRACYRPQALQTAMDMGCPHPPCQPVAARGSSWP